MANGADGAQARESEGEGMSRGDFDVGDVVVLRSGSPRMTVERVTENGHVVCTWYQDGRREVTTLPAETLEPPRGRT